MHKMFLYKWLRKSAFSTEKPLTNLDSVVRYFLLTLEKGPETGPFVFLHLAPGFPLAYRTTLTG